MKENNLKRNIPVQMISCTDTDGKITPIRFRFKDSNGSLVTVNIEQVLRTEITKTIISCTCTAEVYGRRKSFVVFYSFFSRIWCLKSDVD